MKTYSYVNLQGIANMDKMGLLEELLEKLNIGINEEQKKMFEKYYSLLLEKNKVMNLTRITKEDEIITKHFVDSLLIATQMDMNKVGNMIDIGTGAGFPGLPIKIMYPKIKVTLLDSLDKRVKFLNEVIEELGLEDVKAIHGRAEDFGQEGNYREKYDLCVSRAVANLSTLSEYCIPFVKVGGEFVSYKATGAEAEIDSSRDAVELLGAEIKKISKQQLPGGEIERTFVIVRKNKKTDSKYPRRAGKPSKNPL